MMLYRCCSWFYHKLLLLLQLVLGLEVVVDIAVAAGSMARSCVVIAVAAGSMARSCCF